MNGMLRCPSCDFGREPVAVPGPCPRCGVPLRYEGELPHFRPEELSGRGGWRYWPFLPQVEPVSLGEGGTPLVPSLRMSQELGIALSFKLEGTNPTGSFKDRGATVLVSVLQAFGVRAVLDDSSGNAGAALAAYAARAGLRAWLFVPAYASEKKLAQIQAYGAELVRIPGPRGGATKAAREYADDQEIAYASHNESPYFVAGLRTLAYEIAEDRGFDVPDHVVVPLGGGGLFLGLCRGFSELRKLGWIARVPRVHAVQAAACAPIAQAFAMGLPAPVEIEPGESVAEGVLIAWPPRGREILAELGACGGAAVAVPDEATLFAQEELARKEGLYVEPTSAVAVAALPALIARGAIHPGEEVIVPLTGTGLKGAPSSS